MTLAPAIAGTHVIGWLRERGRSRNARESLAVRISRAAAAEDLVVFPLSRYALEPLKSDALVLGYGGLTPRDISAGTERLAHAIRSVLR